MNTNEFISHIPSYIELIKNRGMGKEKIKTCKYVLNHFQKYCISNNISEIDMEVIKQFYNEQYDFDIYNCDCIIQNQLKFPILNIYDFCNIQEYKLHYKKKIKFYTINDDYKEILKEYQNVIMSIDTIKTETKLIKITYISRLLEYLSTKKLKILEITLQDITPYVISLKEYCNEKTIAHIQRTHREFFNWLFEKGYSKISGSSLFKYKDKNYRRELISTYSIEEIKSIISSIDNSTKQGKQQLAMISLFVYYGLRCGDVINLKFDNIDWEKNQLNIIQQKTGKLLILPLIDEVKYPLLDYIKNARGNSIDKEYVFCTINGVCKKYRKGGGIYATLQKILEQAKIDIGERHHGTHLFRHSLATNMVNNNIPVNNVTDILGHSCRATTEIYIKKDVTHLSKLALEVPYE